MRLRSVIIALLLIPLLAVSAGAIYIEGQAPAIDDGEAHILAAETGVGSPSVVTPYDDVLVPTAYSSGPIKRYLSDDPNDYVLVPGNEPGMVYALGDMGTAPDSVTTTMPSVSIPQIGSFAIPYDTIGTEISGIMNSPAVTFSMPDMAIGNWYDLTADNFKFNMPMLSFPVI